jgi:hypothetical protein
MPAKLKPLPQISVADFARKATEGAKNAEDAAKALLAMAKADPDLYRKIMEPYEFSACRDAIDRLRLNERAAIWKAAQGETRSNTSVRALARANTYTLLDFPLPSGTRLGDATVSDLTDAIGVYRAQASDMARKARFLELVCGRLKEGQRVSEALTPKELEDVQKEVL